MPKDTFIPGVVAAPKALEVKRGRKTVLTSPPV